MGRTSGPSEPLESTGPARPGGARCIVEADTTREPQHPSIGRRRVAVPVKRDDPPTAVAAAFLDPRWCRRDPASATERIHSGTALRAHGSTSIHSAVGSERCVDDLGWPAGAALRLQPHPDPPLRPAMSSGSAATSVRRSNRGEQTRNVKTPRARGELAGRGFSRCASRKQAGRPLGAARPPTGLRWLSARRRRTPAPRAAACPRRLDQR
jgi:hypothetical protein